GVPLLALEPQRQVRRPHVRLLEVRANAAIERRYPYVRAGGSRAAEKIEVVVLRVGAGFLLGSVADPEIQALMLRLDDRDARRHLLGLAIEVERLDVHELEQLHAVEPPFGVLQLAPAVQVARLVRNRPADDADADRAIAGDLYLTEARDFSGLG